MTGHEVALVVEQLVPPVPEKDRAAVIGLEADAFTSPWTAETFDRMMDTRVSRVYVARGADRGIVGFCACWVIDDEMHVNTVAVVRTRRRQGIGERLMRDAIRLSGARRVTLEVRRSNLAALALYRKLGFEVTAARRDYYQNPVEDGLILWWNP